MSGRVLMWAGLIASVGAAVPVGAAGDIRPVHSARMLAAHSDLVVVGTQEPSGAIRIETVVKGRWATPTIAVDLAEFDAKPISHFWSGPQPDLTGQVVAFVDLRFRPRIVANGLFRIGKPGGPGVYSYWQPANPGGYTLCPKASDRFGYADLAAILKEAREGIVEAAKKQKELLTAIREAKDTATALKALESLEPLTRLGDVAIQQAVASLIGPGRIGAQDFVMYACNVRDPESWPLVKEVYEKTQEDVLLLHVWQIGSMESLAYLKSIAYDKSKRPYARYAALHAIRDLAGRLREAGREDDARAVDKVWQQAHKELWGQFSQ